MSTSIMELTESTPLLASSSSHGSTSARTETSMISDDVSTATDMVIDEDNASITEENAAITEENAANADVSGTATTDTVTVTMEDTSQDLDPEGSSSKMGNLRTMMTVINGNMGTGVLVMPYAIYCSGLLVGPVCLLLMGVIALCCMHFLIRSRWILQKRAEEEEGEEEELNYANLMAWALRATHRSLRGWPATGGRRFVNTLLLVSQLGFCTVSIVFMASNIQEAVTAVTSWDMSLRMYQLAVGGVVALYSQVRGIKKLAPCAALANILTVLGLIIIFANFFGDELPAVTTRPAFAGWSLIPVFFGTTVFSFEGISLVLPLEKDVKDRERFAAPWGVLTLSLTIVVLLYVSMGFCGYLVYGDSTLATITLNLPVTPWYYLAVRPLFSAAALLSYNYQLYVPVEMTKGWLVVRQGWTGLGMTTKRNRAEAAIRLGFCLLTLVVSIAVPDLDLLISFVGAFASSFLTMILPSLIYLLTLFTLPHRAPAPLVAFLILVIIVGFLGFVIGTYSSVSNIVYSS